MIIPMVEEPLDTEMELISRTWNHLALPLKLPYRPIHGFELSLDQFTIRLRRKDLNHFGFEELRKDRNPDVVRVYAPFSSFLSIDKQIIRTTLKKLSEACSHMEVIEITDADATMLDIIRDCLVPVRISRINIYEYTGCHKTKFQESNFQVVAKEMAKKHKTKAVNFNGSRVYV